MINRFTVEGRLTKDIELKKTTNGTFVSEFDIACTRNRKNDAGEYDSDFFRCKVFSKLAEIAEKYGQKGRRVLVDGRLQVRRYEAKDGTQRTITELIVDNISFMPMGEKASGKAAYKPSDNAQPEAQTNPYKQYQTPPQTQEMAYGDLYDGITEEDMPW